MTQPKHHSLIETLLNIGSGFIVSLAVWEYLVKPIWHLETTHADNIAITALFTVVSIIRSYFWRRLGNWYSHRSQT